ncbi:adenosylcobinamide-GDP ribazoletransferase [Oscillospiraceae bacterium MB08-C2-2]|nr:adenosylcobinamide-GDP ribazoletransferase [Oscillospiraceae bacterium MB08-C2-2]
MKRFFKGFVMTVGMFSILPVPPLWEDSLMRLMLPLLPLVGLVIGALWMALAYLLEASALHPAMTAALVAVFPYVLTGFIHLDGYMDTSDAVLSRRPLEKRREILKDPHLGAFGAIMLAGLFLLAFAGAWAFIEGGENPLLLLLVPVVSRCGCGAATLALPPISNSGYAYTFQQTAGKQDKLVPVITAIAAGVTAFGLAGPLGAAVVLATAGGFCIAMGCAFRSMKGVSGDLAGFALTVAELCGLWAAAIL